MAGEHAIARLCVWSYLHVRDLVQLLGRSCFIIFVSQGGNLLQARPRVSAMYREAAWMGSKHLLLELQVEELLGPFKSLSQSLRGQAMISDVDEADILTCFDELLRNGFPLLQWSIGSPGLKIDQGNRWLVCSHDINSDTWQQWMFPIVVEDCCGGEICLCPRKLRRCG